MTEPPLHRDLLPWYRSRFWLAFMAGSVAYLGTFLVVSSADPDIDPTIAQLLPLGLAIVAGAAVGLGPLLSSWLVARLWPGQSPQEGAPIEGGRTPSRPAPVPTLRRRLAARLRRRPAALPPLPAARAQPEPEGVPPLPEPLRVPAVIATAPTRASSPPEASRAPAAPLPAPAPHPAEPQSEGRALTREELAATEEVLRGVAEAPPPGAMSKPGPSVFRCLQCGAEMEPGLARCPGCGVRYLPEEEGALEEPLGEEETALLDLLDAQLPVRKERSPIIHFDAEAGRISYLDETIEPNVELAFECDSCGAVVQADLPRCPNCGAIFEGEGAGILDLVADLEFTEAPDELHCPHCGSRTPFTSLSCLRCKKSLDDPRNRALVHLVPLLEGPGIIFVHLDVEGGRVSYLQRGAGAQSRIYHEQTLQLDRIGREKFEERWKGLGRV